MSMFENKAPDWVRAVDALAREQEKEKKDEDLSGRERFEKKFSEVLKLIVQARRAIETAHEIAAKEKRLLEDSSRLYPKEKK